MSRVMGLLSILVSIYMALIFFRIILTWFSWSGNSSVEYFLAGITDPYLNWFRRFRLRIGFLDLSPIVALGVLSILKQIFSTLAYYRTISVSLILIMALRIVWGALSFFLGFIIIVLILRFAALLLRANRYNPFWRVVDAVSQPVLYRINRVFFKNRIVNYKTQLILSIAIFVFVYLALKVLFSLVLVGLALARFRF